LESVRDITAWSGDDAGVVPELIGQSESMVGIAAWIRRLAPCACIAVVTGETGTGKGVVARLLHRLSGREGPFVRVSATALEPGVFRSELWGHVKGAFTCAYRDRQGLVAEADRGTFFFDELQDTALAVQPSLLDYLDGEGFRPVGGGRAVRPAARTVVASQVPLDELVRTGRLRGDLRGRLGWMDVALPPLRERLEDLEPLAVHFARIVAGEEHIPVPRLSRPALAGLRRYRWPWNVRELREVVRYAAIASGGEAVEPRHLPAALLRASDRGAGRARRVRTDDEVMVALRATGGNVTAAAARLENDPRTLWRRLKKLGVRPGDVGRDRCAG
jgi:DNA-binding NtrC family response regulator